MALLKVFENILIAFQACENGRGAILLSVARGKVSEGIDFSELHLTLHNPNTITLMLILVLDVLYQCLSSRIYLLNNTYSVF